MAGQHWSEAPLDEVTLRGVSLSPYFAGLHGNHISSDAKLFAFVKSLGFPRVSCHTRSLVCQQLLMGANSFS